MIIKLARPKYYPLKVKNGYRIARTTEPEKSLGFSTFKSLKIAKYMGRLWYGSFLGFDKLSYVRRK